MLLLIHKKNHMGSFSTLKNDLQGVFYQGLKKMGNPRQVNDNSLITIRVMSESRLWKARVRLPISKIKIFCRQRKHQLNEGNVVIVTIYKAILYFLIKVGYFVKYVYE